MLKFYISIILAALSQTVQCRPQVTGKSTASATSHVFVGNTTSTNNQHMDSFVSKIGNVEKELDNKLKQNSPYLNFLFNTVDDDTDEDDDCLDEMVILLVPQYVKPKTINKPEDNSDKPIKKEQRKISESPKITIPKDISSEDKEDRTRNRYFYIPRDSYYEDSEYEESSEEFDEDDDTQSEEKV